MIASSNSKGHARTARIIGASRIIALCLITTLASCENKVASCTNCGKLAAVRSQTGLRALSPDLVRAVISASGKEIWTNPAVHYENATEQGFYQKTQEYVDHRLLYEEDTYIAAELAKNPDPDAQSPERVRAILRVWLKPDGEIDRVEAFIQPTRGQVSARDVLDTVKEWK